MVKRASKRALVLPAAEQHVVHRVIPELLRRPVRILVVGCGGNGGEIVSGLPYLHQAMLAHGHPGGLDVLLMDGDTVSTTNTVRQPFTMGDVGHPKATLLAGRVNAFWQLEWRALARYLSPAGQGSGTGLACDIVIGCVDSRRARQVIRDRVIADTRVSYWLDLGNDASTGQFVLGQPARLQRSITRAQFVKGKKSWPKPTPEAAGPDRLPTVAELYPETTDAAADKGDNRPSCSTVEALTRQEPFVNRALAGQALAMLARLFRYGELTYHGGFVNLATGRTVSIPIPAAPVAIVAEPSTKGQRRTA